MRGWVPDLLRGRGKSIDGDLDIDDECSEQIFEPLQSLHHCSVRYQSVQQKLTSPRSLSLHAQLRTQARTKKMPFELWMND
jgi:hypothetical protein